MMKKGHEHHQHHMCMKEFHDMEDMKFTLNVVINKDKEIGKITVDIKGENKDEKNEKHQMKLAAELCFKG
jgi:nickel-dependent lactate racemase